MSLPDLIPDIRAHLNQVLGIPVVMVRPEQSGTTPPPSRFVLLIPTGGAGRFSRVIHGIQLTIDAYGPTGGTARTVALELDNAMYRLPVSALPIAKVTGSTPAADVDPDTNQPRYTATYQLTTITH